MIEHKNLDTVSLHSYTIKENNLSRIIIIIKI